MDDDQDKEVVKLKSFPVVLDPKLVILCISISNRLNGICNLSVSYMQAC